MLCLCVVPISLLLSRPEVILLDRLGSVVWYPATALSLALMLAVSPWYFFLGCFTDTLASALFYHQPLQSYSELLSTIGTNSCFALAAYLLRGPLQIDFGLRRQRDVARYLLVTTVAGLASSVLGVAGLALDGTISWNDFQRLRFVLVLRGRHRALRGCTFSSDSCFPWHPAQIIWPEVSEFQRRPSSPPDKPLGINGMLEGDRPGLRYIACALSYLRTPMGVA